VPVHDDDPSRYEGLITEGIPENLVTIPLVRPAESTVVSTFVLFLASDES
jgi:3alpha(or 20beta)-hydroxysteroid dehydrogenase